MLTSSLVFLLGHAIAIRAANTEASSVFETKCNNTLTQEFGDTKYNATGSVSFQMITPQVGNENLTFGTGFIADRKEKGTLEQTFWIQPDRLIQDDGKNDTDVSSCIQLYTLLPSKAYEQSPKDDGTCETTIGKKCLDAIKKSMDETNNNCKFPEFPAAECNELASDRTHADIINPFITSDNTCRDPNHDTDNKRIFASLMQKAGSDSDPSSSDPNYDGMAQRAYMLILKRQITARSGVETSDNQIFCLRNSNFTDGSTVPDALKSGQPTSTGSQPQGSQKPNGAPGTTKLSGLAMAIAFGVATMFV